MGLLDPQVLADYIEGCGVPYRENSRSYVFVCPRCGKKNKLYIQKSNGSFVCWVCKETEGFQGRPEFALAELTGESIVSIREKLYGGTPIGQTGSYIDCPLRDFFGEDEVIDEDAEELKEIQWPWDYYPIEHQYGARGATYLADRGIPVDVAKLYGIHYAPHERRVVFPIYAGTRLVGWQKRLVVDNKAWNEETEEWVEGPKILSSRGIPRERTVMFSDHLVPDHVVLCEGPVDALKAHLCGSNVATMGKAVSEGQIKLLRNAGVTKFYLALDPDAFAETKRLVCELGDLECYVLNPSPHKDLGEMSMPAVLELFRNAPRVRNINVIEQLVYTPNGRDAVSGRRQQT